MGSAARVTVSICVAGALASLAALEVGAARGRLGPPRHGIYLDATTVVEGERAEAFVSTNYPVVTVEVRNEATGEVAYQVDVDGSAQLTHPLAWGGAGWERSLTLPILPPGLYSVQIPIESIDADQRHLPQGQNTFVAPLVVTPAVAGSLGDVLLVLETGTWDAYNEFGGRSYYTDPFAVRVSHRRPGFPQASLGDLARAGQILEGLGHGWEVADEDYVDDHPGLLDAYRLVVLIGKFEYVTRGFRSQLESYVESGGRIAAIAIELSTIQARREGGVRVCYKNPSRGPDPVELDGDPSNDHLATYDFARIGEPVTRLTGLSFYLGGWSDVDTTWTVHRRNHWIWAGTGLNRGDPIGSVRALQLIDGTLVRFAHEPYPDRQEQTETPDDFLILATVPTVNARPWWCWADGSKGINECAEPGWGVMGIRQTASGGILATIPDVGFIREDWDADANVRTVVENLLGQLASPGPVDAYAPYQP